MGFDKLSIPETGSPVSFSNGSIVVPDNPVITFIEGDGVGPDINSHTLNVIDAAVQACYGSQKKISWLEIYAGQKTSMVYDNESWFPEDTTRAIETYRVVLKGPVATLKGSGNLPVNQILKDKFDLYACLRPIKYIEGVPSPVKHPEKIDLMIFRENSEDIYSGIEYRAGSEQAADLLQFLKNTRQNHKVRFAESSAFAVKPVSEQGSRRLVKAAIEYAIEHKKHSVTLVHKGNTMSYTEGAFARWGYQLASEEFGDQVIAADECGGNPPRGKILIQDIMADTFLQTILTSAHKHAVVATLNLNGDYISDAMTGQVGNVGMAPGGCINYQTGVAIFEGMLGTSPKYAGLDKINPVSLILSGALMLDYLNWREASELLFEAVQKTILQKKVTYDLARQIDGATELKCSEFARAVIENIDELAPGPDQ